MTEKVARAAAVLTFNPATIKALREGMGLTQAEFGRRIGEATNQPAVTRQAVWGWETGVQKPTIDNLLAIVNTFGARLEGFFRVAV